MPGNDPQIPWHPALSSQAFQAIFPVLSRLQYSSPDLQFATKNIARPQRNHRPDPARPGQHPAVLHGRRRHRRLSRRPPVHLITHRGTLIIRVPRQEDNAARHLASEAGCYVVTPSYDTNPQGPLPRRRTPSL